MKRSGMFLQSFGFLILLLQLTVGYGQNKTLAGFSTSSTYAEIPDGPAYDITGAITLEAWIYPTAWRAMHQGQIISKIEESSNSGYFLGVGDGGNVKFVFIDGSNFKVINTNSGPLSLNNWQHVAAVYDGVKMYIYINGELIIDGYVNGSIATNNRPVAIGRADEDHDRYFVGKIDEVRIWNTDVSGQNIFTWYNNTLGACHPDYSNLVGYYECDDDSPSTTLEATVGSDGTVNNAFYETANNSEFLGAITGFKTITAFQANTENVPRGVSNNDILKLAIVTLGDNALTQIVLRTDGTTNVGDIQNARIWATGTNDNFATGTQFGSTVFTPPAPGSNMVFSGNYSLTGCNTYYFWLSYDIKANATINNVVDGMLQNATIQSVVRTPLVSDPPGNRTIADLSYCNSNSSGACQYITNVTYAGINNTSGETFGNPVNYTDQEASVNIGGTNLISVTINYCWNTPRIYAFIDWNKNGVLNDAGEVFTVASTFSGSGTYSMNIEVPNEAELGSTRMRVMFQWNWDYPQPNPCLTGFYGESEDYSVYISESSLPIELISFTGYADKSSNVLEWTTSQEINTDRFVIERSEKGVEWHNVASLSAVGESRDKNSYRTNDNDPFSKAYYRLKTIAKDGNFQLSDMILIERQSQTFYIKNVMPNPGNGTFKVEFNNPDGKEGKIMLFNSLGIQVYQDTFSGNADLQEVFVNADRLVNGIYTLMIELQGKVISQKIGINK